MTGKQGLVGWLLFGLIWSFIFCFFWPRENSVAHAQSSNTVIDWSGSIATGGTSQQAIPSSPTFIRRMLMIVNPCNATDQGIATAENLYVNFTSAASSANSVPLQSCGSILIISPSPVTSEQVNVVAATSSHKYVAKEIR